MATLTMSLSGSAVVNGTKSWTVSDADVTTLVNYLVAKYSNPAEGAPALSATQALLAWVQGFVTSTQAEVQLYQKQQQIAAMQVTPLAFT